MGIICKICQKKQSGWIQDYPLSKKHLSSRICVDCYEHLDNAKRGIKIDEAKDYFQSYLSSENTPKEVIDVLTSAFEVVDENEQATVVTQEVDGNFVLNANNTVASSQDIGTVYKSEPNILISQKSTETRVVNRNNNVQEPVVSSDPMGMFGNIGSKIKILAQVCTWVGIIGSIIGGLVLIALDTYLIIAGLLIAAVGSLISWASSFVLYGFGQLIENTDKLVILVNNQNQTNKN
jgi:hypothetical protein